MYQNLKATRFKKLFPAQQNAQTQDFNFNPSSTVDKIVSTHGPQLVGAMLLLTLGTIARSLVKRHHVTMNAGRSPVNVNPRKQLDPKQSFVP